MSRTLRSLLVLLALFLAIQIIPVTRENPTSDPGLELSAPIDPLVQRACYDCHSDHTVWPWYAHVAPVSWLIAHDVKEGRRHLNLSRWHSNPPGVRGHLAQEMVAEVARGGMPLPIYVILHPAAKITPDERPTLEHWAQSVTLEAEGATSTRGTGETPAEH